ncbi:hypothetical protein DVR12_01160 [Chitinophaga silvatica]|uniref:Leucine-rich repeat domain-containing protein n=1 Tax=Chitinophaga silvatica TaxID=2282649 RepID=A0A3E1YGA2_9BACT|nr:WG repeat-containing protein [Chitinophaga silvatica]RFS26427.1 hypothetical protein DVR12_01160 [Chitinophaga silvatica]
MKRVNRHHFIFWVVMLSLIAEPIFAQKKTSTAKPAVPEKWYPIYRKDDCIMPALINKAGEVKLVFDSITTFASQMIIEDNIFEGNYIGVKRRIGDKKIYCLCDRNGKFTPLPEGIKIVALNPNSITVENESGKSALWGFNLTPITPFIYLSIQRFSEGLAVAFPAASRTFTFLNEKGEETIPATHRISTVGDHRSSYAMRNQVSEGLSNYSHNGLLGIMDKNGKDITPAVFSNLFEFKNGLAFAIRDRKAGYINKTGDWVIGPESGDTYYGNFANGLAPKEINENGEYYSNYIDTTGKVIIKTKFKRASLFNNGFAVVTTNENKSSEKSIINKTGEVVFTGNFSHAAFLDDLIVITTEVQLNSDNVRRNNWYYLDYNFKLIWEPECGERALRSLTSIRNCQLKDFKKIIIESGISNEYSFSDLQELFENANPVVLSLSLNYTITKLPNGLSNMTNLEELRLSGRFTELPDLSKLNKLKEIDLDYTDIQSLPKSIYKLKQLKEISVVGTKLSLNDIMALKENLPDTKITFKRSF